MERELSLYNLAPHLGYFSLQYAHGSGTKKLYTPSIVPGFLGDTKLLSEQSEDSESLKISVTSVFVTYDYTH